MFNINFQDIGNKLVPFKKRKTRLLSFLHAILKPLITLIGSFNIWKDKIDYDLKFTGQIIYLERLLNDLFDNVNRGIYIDDNSNISNTYIYNKIEVRQNFYLNNISEAEPPKYLINQSENINQVHFIVKVPASVVFTEVYMRSIIDKYKQAGVNYLIQII